MCTNFEQDRSSKQERIGSVLSGTVFYGLIVTIFVSTLSHGREESWLGPLVSAIICFFGMVRICEGLVRQQFGLSGSWIFVPLIGLVVVGLVQLLPFATAEGPSSYFASTLSLDPVETRNFIVRFASYIICGEALLHCVNSNKRIGILTATVIIIGSMSALFGFGRMIMLNEFPRLGAEGGGFAQFANRNHFAFLIEMTVGLVLGMLGFLPMTSTIRRLLWVIVILGAFAVLFSQSRGGMFSLFVIGAVAIVIRLNFRYNDTSDRSAMRTFFLPVPRRIALAVSAVMILLALLVSSVIFIGGEALITRFERLSREIDPPTSGQLRRVDIWSSTIKLIVTRPVLGSGFGAYEVAITRFDESTGSFDLQQAHNEYLDIAACGGIIAILFSVWFLFVLGQRAVEVLKFGDSYRSAIAVGALFGLAQVLIHSFADFGLRVTVNALVFIVMAVLASARFSTDHHVRAGAPNKVSNHWKPLKLVTYMLITLIIFGFNIMTAVSNYFVQSVADIDSTRKINSAIRLDPLNYNAWEKRAVLNGSSGRSDTAVTDVLAAIDLRPRDYELWVRLGSTYAAANDAVGAQEAFQKAIELAPNYAGPKWKYGEFLLDFGSEIRGFHMLCQAADIQGELASKLVSLARKMYSDDAARIDAVIKLQSPVARRTAALHLIDANIRSSTVTEIVTSNELTDEEKQDFVWLLIDKKDFVSAYRAWASQAKNQGRSDHVLFNGSFEDGAATWNSGFDWSLPAVGSGARAHVISTASYDGAHSIAIDYIGHSDPLIPVLSQLVMVEPSTTYKITFAALVEDEFMSGGPPIVELFDAASGIQLGSSPGLTADGHGWKHYVISFETANSIEAIAIRVRRRPCAESLCPAFGRVLLDNFEISRD